MKEQLSERKANYCDDETDQDPMVLAPMSSACLLSVEKL